MARALGGSSRGSFFKDHFAGLAVGDLGGIDDAARFSALTTMRSSRTKTGSVKSRSSSDSGVENSKIRPAGRDG
jgi:hypothetical protein